MRVPAERRHVNAIGSVCAGLLVSERALRGLGRARRSARAGATHVPTGVARATRRFAAEQFALHMLLGRGLGGQERLGAEFAQRGNEFLGGRRRVRSLGRGGNHAAAVAPGDHRPSKPRRAVRGDQHGDATVTIGAQGRQDGALGAYGLGGPRLVDGGRHFGGLAGGAGLHQKCALTGGREKMPRIEPAQAARMPLGQAGPLQTRRGEDYRVQSLAAAVDEIPTEHHKVQQASE